MKLPSRLLTIATLASAAIGARPARAGDPTTSDCLAATESSLALRNAHKLREARAQLLVCSAASCPADMRDECTRRVAEVNAAIPTIVFAVKDTAGNDLVAVKLTMDGQPVAERLEGTALSMDPGAHTFTFETAGHATVQKQFVIREGEKDRRERIVFSEAVATTPVGSAAVGGTAPGATLTSSPSGGAGAPPSGLGAQRIGAIVAAGVGVVGFGLGIGLGLDSRSKHDSAMAVCPNSLCPVAPNGDSKGVDLENQAISAGNVSTAAFIVGVVGLAGGAALWFTGKPESSGGATQVGLGPGALQVRGSW